MTGTARRRGLRVIHRDLNPVNRVMAGIAEITGQRMSQRLAMAVGTNANDLIMIKNTYWRPLRRGRIMAGITYYRRIQVARWQRMTTFTGIQNR